MTKLYQILSERKKQLVYFPLLFYWLLLFVATTLPSKALPSLGVSDKIEHFFAYMVLAFLVLLTFHFQEKIESFHIYPVLSTIAIVSIYGLLDELHQNLIPGRDPEVYDWVANFLGAVVGVIILNYLFLKPLKEKNKRDRIKEK
ncbi:MAG: hypothetical protein GXO87_03395 [Chlorobi bacterium]|nr:hypothetical protein [Chlorobiota bacterium]